MICACRIGPLSALLRSAAGSSRHGRAGQKPRAPAVRRRAGAFRWRCCAAGLLACGCSSIRARPISPPRCTGSGCMNISGSGCGTSTGTPATTCPATACCSRRWPRWSGCARWRCCAVLVSVALFERLVLDARRPRGPRDGARCLFAVAAVGDVWRGRLDVRARRDAGAGVRVSRCMRGRRARGGNAGGAVRGGEPRGGVLLALAGLTYALAQGAARRAGLALAGPVVLVVVPIGMLFPKAGTSPIR